MDWLLTAYGGWDGQPLDCPCSIEFCDVQVIDPTFEEHLQIFWENSTIENSWSSIICSYTYWVKILMRFSKHTRPNSDWDRMQDLNLQSKKKSPDSSEVPWSTQLGCTIPDMCAGLHNFTFWSWDINILGYEYPSVWHLCRSFVHTCLFCAPDCHFSGLRVKREWG